MSVSPIPESVERAVILFDVDGTLITTGGAGSRSWRWAFDRLYGIPADIGRFSEAGMTDPVVGRSTFRGVLGREPTSSELSWLLAAYLRRLPREVASSLGYRVLPGVEPLLRRLSGAGHLLGIVTGALEGAARIKLARGDLNRFFAFGGYGSDSDDRVELTSTAIERASAFALGEVDPRSVFVVGDTPRDVEAALGAGAVPIGVASGGYDATDLLRAGAADVVVALDQPIPAFGL
jgi:phosphoglycolate phosphatase-like HAD superfamily hydrolase